MSIHIFPTVQDRQNVHNTINNYAQGKCSMNDMLRTIGSILERFNLTKMHIHGYSVSILKYIPLRINGEEHNLPIIYFKSDHITEKCPTCGAGEEVARYLRTAKENHNEDFDIVNMTCLDCGCVYSVKGANHRVNSSVIGDEH